MIISKAAAEAAAIRGEPEVGFGPATLQRLSDAGGLTQFGAFVQTLEPGTRSSDRHWHEHEDEFLYMLSGEAVVIDDGGAHWLAPGDSVSWPAGDPNAHQVVNRSDAPCSYLICGTRVPRDVVHYPGLGRTLYIDGRVWRIEDAEGTVVKNGIE